MNKYQEALDDLKSMDLMEWNYPHKETIRKALEIASNSGGPSVPDDTTTTEGE